MPRCLQRDAALEVIRHFSIEFVLKAGGRIDEDCYWVR